MCTYCMISDWGRDNWMPSVPITPALRPSLEEFENLIMRVKELEDRLGISCPDNEHKQAWIKELREKLDELERRP